VLEYIVGGLSVLVILMGALAWLYRKGKSDGITDACGKRIEEKIDALAKKVADNRKHDDEIHGKLFDEIKDVQDLFIRHLDK